MGIAQRLRLLGVTVAAMLLGVTFLVFVPTSAQAALPTCTDWSTRWEQGGFGNKVLPSVGNNTGQYNCKLNRGVRNSGVWVLQLSLQRCNGAKDLEVDGIYGPHTEAVIIVIQTVNKITVDGVYGPQTLKAMEWVHFSKDGKIQGCAHVGEQP